MVKHLFRDFLESRDGYGSSVDQWVRLWNGIDSGLRARYGWRQPWLRTEWEKGGAYMDGNPIFSAHTPSRQYAIRIIQYPPTSSDLEFDWWLDSFGGTATDPDSIDELVIACALSEEALADAFDLMQPWVSCRGISITNRRHPAVDYPAIEPSVEELDSEFAMI